MKFSGSTQAPDDPGALLRDCTETENGNRTAGLPAVRQGEGKLRLRSATTCDPAFKSRHFRSQGSLLSGPHPQTSTLPAIKPARLRILQKARSFVNIMSLRFLQRGHCVVTLSGCLLGPESGPTGSEGCPVACRQASEGARSGEKGLARAEGAPWSVRYPLGSLFFHPLRTPRSARGSNNAMASAKVLGACAAENFSGKDFPETVDILQRTGETIPT